MSLLCPMSIDKELLKCLPGKIRCELFEDSCADVLCIAVTSSEVCTQFTRPVVAVDGSAIFSKSVR